MRKLNTEFITDFLCLFIFYRVPLFTNVHVFRGKIEMSRFFKKNIMGTLNKTYGLC
jgi:hypothetical protein